MNNQSVLPVALGGTGATTAANARSNLGTLSSANGAVTRAKLANDALYSPVVIAYAGKNIAASDLGKTYVAGWTSAGSNLTWTLDKTISASLPVGFEMAFCEPWVNDHVKLSIGGVRAITMGSGQFTTTSTTKTVTISERGGMFAIKKLYTDAKNGDVWFLTGPVEIA